MASKKTVKKWLKERSLVFTEMADAQKAILRTELNICGAATAVSRWSFPCSFTPMPNGRCKKHGGLTPRGVDSVHYIHGKYAAGGPSHLLEDVEAYYHDPQYMRLRAEIAIARGRLKELYARVETGESTQAWGLVLQSQALFDMASQTGFGVEQVRQAHTLLREATSNPDDNRQVWDDIMKTWNALEKLISQENRLLTAMDNVVLKFQLAIALDRIKTIIRTYIPKAKDRLKAANEIDRQLGGRTNGRDKG